MQRTLNNTIPAQQRAQPQQGAQYSPAYIMASRIRNEQGRERAAEYLSAMEPFLAPGEREHIANMLDIPLKLRTPAAYTPQQAAQPRPAQSAQAPMPGMGAMGDTMQLMQLLGSLGGAGKSQPANAQGGINPLMLAQLLGSLMGKK